MSSRDTEVGSQCQMSDATVLLLSLLSSDITQTQILIKMSLNGSNIPVLDLGLCTGWSSLSPTELFWRYLNPVEWHSYQDKLSGANQLIGAARYRSGQWQQRTATHDILGEKEGERGEETVEHVHTSPSNGFIFIKKCSDSKI